MKTVPYFLDGHIKLLAPGNRNAGVQVVELGSAKCNGLVLHLVGLCDVFLVDSRFEAIDFLLEFLDSFVTTHKDNG